MTTDAEPQLRRNSLGLPELVFHAVTHIAPATSVVFIFPAIAHQAGPAMPLSFVLTTIVCMFVGSTVFQFSKYVPSSGGYYSFSTRGLGSRSGFMATWSYLIYEIIGAAAAVGFLGYLLSDMLKAEFHLNVPWWLVASVTTALIWSLTHRGIQLSARISTLLGGIELLIMLALLAVVVLYVMANLALTRYMRREQPAHFTVWRHVLVPWVATLALLPVLFVTVYPLPPWPYNLTPYLFLISLISGFAYMEWREWRNPGTLNRGAMMLIRGGSAGEGEEDAEGCESVLTEEEGCEV